jgi:hypothetical protein
MEKHIKHQCIDNFPREHRSFGRKQRQVGARFAPAMGVLRREKSMLLPKFRLKSKLPVPGGKMDG